MKNLYEFEQAWCGRILFELCKLLWIRGVGECSTFVWQEFWKGARTLIWNEFSLIFGHTVDFFFFVNNNLTTSAVELSTTCQPETMSQSNNSRIWSPNFTRPFVPPWKSPSNTTSYPVVERDMHVHVFLSSYAVISSSVCLVFTSVPWHALKLPVF